MRHESGVHLSANPEARELQLLVMRVQDRFCQDFARELYCCGCDRIQAQASDGQIHGKCTCTQWCIGCGELEVDETDALCEECKMDLERDLREQWEAEDRRDLLGEEDAA